MKKLIFILAVLFLAGSSRAQNAFEFLRLETSPRAAAMAGSFVSNTDDPNVIFYNPAGIGSLKGQPVSFSFMKHLLDINSASLSYSRLFEGIGRFGAAVQYINYGSFTKADEFGNKTGNFGAADIAFSLAYSNIIDENFYYGATVKFIYSGIDERSSTAAAMDLGLQYRFPSSQWTIGFSVLNAGAQITNYVSTSEDLPLDIRLGISKRLLHLPFTFYLSLNRLNANEGAFSDRIKYFSFGGEFRMSKVLRIRFGYDNEKRKELKIGTTAGLAGFSLGIGAIISKYRLDYAVSSLGSIGSFHRFGLSTEI
jgi:hypothetical protein